MTGAHALLPYCTKENAASAHNTGPFCRKLFICSFIHSLSNTYFPCDQVHTALDDCPVVAVSNPASPRADAGLLEIVHADLSML